MQLIKEQYPQLKVPGLTFVKMSVSKQTKMPLIDLSVSFMKAFKSKFQ